MGIKVTNVLTFVNGILVTKVQLGGFGTQRRCLSDFGGA